ncbi:EAL domain-containing protein [Enterovibrio sp. ZSDZ42]|uniref:EAL domain-containing protein n=1 Tax=Enterovibrio gelatinilyticus TaxID=2899819 RepID=A0ABT5QVR5_9GAMM|nr:EAL domain-containing protein [Enterovibrio sp. ZSDZ42]MDD1792112.1 EAL domain-containing protein [Enterovibrio sp. ZSDZ42]
MDNHLRTRGSFEQCLSTNENGELIALYDDLVLRSVYQPIFRADGSTLGFEALVRANTVNDEPVCPAHLFRELDIDHPHYRSQIDIDRLARVIHLRNFAPYAGEHAIFLNMLPSSAVVAIAKFSSQNLMVKRLAELGISRQHVVLEVVEHLHEDVQALAVASAHSVQNGFRIAIDDYGVSGSQETRVRSLKPSILKIDRSLLQTYMQGETQPLLDGIALAKEVYAEVLVEGIENEAEYAAMKMLAVDYFQGFHLGMPQRLSDYFQPSKKSAVTTVALS